MSSKKEQIIAEQKMKAEHIEELNNWLEQEEFGFEVINYSACGFKGSKKDNKKSVRTIKLIAKDLQESIDHPNKKPIQFNQFGFPL